MIYSADELFRFEENTYTRFGGYTLCEYLKKDDPTITEIEIPAVHNGKRVTMIFGLSRSKYIKRVVVPPSVRIIEGSAFYACSSLENAEFSEGTETIGASAFGGTGLKIVVLPKTLKSIGTYAFMDCRNLERVEFNSKPKIELSAFGECPKLPPEIVAMGLARSADITRPLPKYAMLELLDDSLLGVYDYLRPDVFELFAKNNCFRNCDLEYLFEAMIIHNNIELLHIAGQYGVLNSAKLVDRLIEYSVEWKRTEITAYLLDYKNRKFGFNGGVNFEL